MPSLYLEMFEHVLLEGRVQDFENKYTDIPQWAQKKLIDGDFTANKKYLDWLGKTLSRSGKIENENFINDLLRRLKVYHNKLQNKDIYTFKTFDDFKNATDKAETKLTRREALAKDTTVLYEDDRFLVIIPDSFEASQDFSSGQTNWCTTANEGHYDNYRRQGTLIYIRDYEAEKPYNRVAILAHALRPASSRNWDFFDSTDHNPNRDWYHETLPEEAREAIEDYVENADDEVQERMYEYEIEKVAEYAIQDWPDVIFDVCRRALEYYKLSNDYKDDIYNYLEEELGEDTLKEIGKSIIEWTVNYHGIDDIGYIPEYDKFSKRWEAYPEEYKTDLLDAINEFVRSLSHSDTIKEILLNALGQHNYEILYKSHEVDKAIASAISKYENYMNSPQQKQMFGDISTTEKFVPKNVSNIVRVLVYGGQEGIANFIKAYSRQKIQESLRDWFLK